MTKTEFRTPKNYKGTGTTTRKVGPLLSAVLSQINSAYEERPDLVLAAWPEIIGPQLAPMTQAVSFVDGILTVKVKNSTLYSLLCRQDKYRILTAIQKRFPKVAVNNIAFRIA